MGSIFHRFVLAHGPGEYATSREAAKHVIPSWRAGMGPVVPNLR
jgi:hypothetical protein